MDLNMEFRQLQDIYWLIFPIAILMAAFFGYRKKQAILNWLEMKGTTSFNYLQGFFLVMGLALVILALLGPEREIGTKEVMGQGVDVYFLIDTSKSMLAQDVIPSRIDRSKKVINEIIAGLHGDRIGFIPYASSAYIQMPLTDDYDLARMYLEVIDTDMVGGGGTDVAEALNLSVASFNKAGTGNEVVVLLSDGEEDDADMGKIKSIIEDAGIKVFTVGIGSKDGGLIPLYEESDGQGANGQKASGQKANGQKASGQGASGYKKDDQGNPVVTKLDEDMLELMANLSGGKYYLSDTGLSEVPLLLSDLSLIEKGETTRKKIKEYDLLYQWFLGAGIVSLLLGFLLQNRRKS